MERFRLALLSATVPLVCTLVLLVALVAWRVADLPDPHESFLLIEKWFLAYGLPLVFLAALLEGVAVINLYVPGSAVIVLGVVFSRTDPLLAVLVVFVATVAFIITAQVNYGVGYFGLHRLLRTFGGGVLIDRAEKYWSRHGDKTLPLAFIHPNIGGFVSIASGNGRYPWKKFFVRSVGYTLAWNVLWGVAAFLLADTVAQTVTQPLILLGGLLIWATIAFAVAYLRHGR